MKKTHVKKTLIKLFVLNLAVFELVSCNNDPSETEDTAELASVPSVAAQLPAEPNFAVESCPRFQVVDLKKRSFSSTPSLLSNNACWYLSSTSNSCTDFCGKFYGVDTAAMNQIVNKASDCQEKIKALNPQQKDSFKEGASNLAPTGSACAWVIKGKFPSTVWYMVSQSTFSASAKSAETKQLCACNTENYPDYVNLGLSYKNATGTSGKVGVRMSITPTYIAKKESGSSVRGPIECRADATSPLPDGLSFQPDTCIISGTPTTALTVSRRVKVTAYDKGYAETAPSYKSNPAFVTISIAKK